MRKRKGTKKEGKMGNWSVSSKLKKEKAKEQKNKTSKRMRKKK
jgi:hypothetical protein